MFNKISLIFLFLILHLAITIGLKSSNYCMLKQKKCIGFYDSKQNYQIKCDSIKCDGIFNYECGLNICSNKKSECNVYMASNVYIKKLTNIRFEHLLKKTVFKLFNEKIKDCENKSYKFDSADFCVNGKNFMTIINYGFRKLTKKIDCKCPVKTSFKCDELCTIDSNACDYYKSNKKNFTNNINHCGNKN